MGYRFYILLRRVITISLIFSIYPLLPSLYAQSTWNNQDGGENDNSESINISSGNSFFIIDNIAIPSLNTETGKSLSPVANFSSYNTTLFFDSLKNGASNNTVTKTLYNLLIVSEQPGFYKSVNNASNEEFAEHAGKIIRSVNIYTLGPYGLNLSDINISNIYQSDNLLNKTHINTKEKKIRNQLFFSPGDVVDPTKISDNERIIRQLSYIYDCRIVLAPCADNMVDVIVLTKDVYSFGLSIKTYGTYTQGTASIFEKNVLGLGHELNIKVPYDAMDLNNVKLGKGLSYNINNLFKTFANLKMSFTDSMNIESYGASFTRGFYNYAAKYAGGISLSRRQIKEEQLSFSYPQYGKYDTRDIWLARSFLIENEPATRIVLGTRYIYNDAIQRPDIEPQSYQYYQNYQSILGSITFSSQRYHKNNLIYAYGRTEDIPYGGIFTFTTGKEYGEFKDRYYTGVTLSLGQPIGTLGYFHTTLGLASYRYKGDWEQGVFMADIDYLQSLLLRGIPYEKFFEI